MPSEVAEFPMGFFRIITETEQVIERIIWILRDMLCFSIKGLASNVARLVFVYILGLFIQFTMTTV